MIDRVELKATIAGLLKAKPFFAELAATAGQDVEAAADKIGETWAWHLSLCFPSLKSNTIAKSDAVAKMMPLLSGLTADQTLVSTFLHDKKAALPLDPIRELQRRLSDDLRGNAPQGMPLSHTEHHDVKLGTEVKHIAEMKQTLEAVLNQMRKLGLAKIAGAQAELNREGLTPAEGDEYRRILLRGITLRDLADDLQLSITSFFKTRQTLSAYHNFQHHFETQIDRGLSSKLSEDPTLAGWIGRGLKNLVKMIFTVFLYAAVRKWQGYSAVASTESAEALQELKVQTKSFIDSIKDYFSSSSKVAAPAAPNIAANLAPKSQELDSPVAEPRPHTPQLVH